MISRSIKRPKSHSFFLFGARGTGKSTWLREEGFKEESIHWIDLLRFETEDRFQKNPEELEAELAQLSSKKDLQWIVIDEVQKVPRLLDIVHRWIEKKRFHFALTGSSARKLKKGSANLLAGRAFVLHLFPLTSLELGPKFDLSQSLRFGGLPGLLKLEDDDERKLFLRAYAQTYLKEEIVAEQLVRKVTPFRRFLDIAATESGEIVNYSNIAQEVGVDRASVRSYFEILEDTLIGHLLEPYHRSLRKRQRQSPKFYIFDNGVRNALSGKLDLPVSPKTSEYGKAFEHLVINEILHRSGYSTKETRFSYLRTGDGVEIDLVIERQGEGPYLVEIKSTTNIKEKELRALHTFQKEIPKSKAFCLSLDPKAKQYGKVECLPWQEGIRALNID